MQAEKRRLAEVQIIRIATLSIVTFVLFVALFAANRAAAFSPIGEADGYDLEQLEKVGITIERYEQQGVTFDPSLTWVKVTYDCARFPDDTTVAMIVSFSKSHQATGSIRVDRSQAVDGKISLAFAIPRDAGTSKLTVIFKRGKEAMSQDMQLQFYGYSLSLNRIEQLLTTPAVEAETAQPTDESP